jgi:HD-GYP domain-containing protein (c-di-GMP phosphodiesterase class II)
MRKRRITSTELAVGTVMSWDAYDDRGRLLLRKGLVIASNSQVDGLIERGLYAEAPPERQPPVSEEPSAVSSIMEARRRLERLCGPNSRTDDFTYQITCIRALVAQACRLSEDAAVGTLLLARHGRYSIRHSLDVAVVSHIAGVALDMREPDLSSAVAAALTMNFSILELQDVLQAQKEPLTEEQREVIKGHPGASEAQLRDRGVKDELWLQTVLAHHEAIDGSGYGQGKKGDEIPLSAQLVSLADVYCARISSREYRKALSPNSALKALFLDQGKSVRDGLASQFIKAIGVFPAGTPVRLENGEIAVVVQRGEKANAPRVCSIIGPRGMPLTAPIRRDTSMPTCGVREVMTWADVGAPPSMQILWGKVAALH